MGSLIFIIFIISKFKFVALIFTLKSRILTYFFSLIFLFNCVGFFFPVDVFKFYKMKLRSENNNNMRAYRRLKETK